MSAKILPCAQTVDEMLSFWGSLPGKGITSDKTQPNCLADWELLLGTREPSECLCSARDLHCEQVPYIAVMPVESQPPFLINPSTSCSFCLMTLTWSSKSSASSAVGLFLLVYSSFLSLNSLCFLCALLRHLPLLRWEHRRWSQLLVHILSALCCSFSQFWATHSLLGSTQL